MSDDNEFAAAREGDSIEHTASAAGMLLGAIGGAIVGAAFVVATGGMGAIAIAATIGGAVAGGAGVGEVLGSMSWAPTHVTGELDKGSPNVFINGKRAIIAHVSVGKCDEHGPVPQKVAEGSSRVFINGYPVARVGDKLTCSAAISEGSPNVFIGGARMQTDDINPEIPDWVNWTLLGVGLAAAAVLAPPAVALLGAAGGIGGGYAGNFIGGQIFGEGSDGQKWLALGGAFAGGFAGAKGGKTFNARFNTPKSLINLREIEPQLATDPDSAFFWSGRSNGVGGPDVAEAIAKSRGGVTLESTVTDKNIEMPTWDTKNPLSMKAWEDVSASYAKQVSGEVRAVVGQSLREGNIWENVELPRLIGNPKVTKITIIDPMTQSEKIIFVRNN